MDLQLELVGSGASLEFWAWEGRVRAAHTGVRARSCPACRPTTTTYVPIPAAHPPPRHAPSSSLKCDGGRALGSRGARCRKGPCGHRGRPFLTRLRVSPQFSLNLSKKKKGKKKKGKKKEEEPAPEPEPEPAEPAAAAKAAQEARLAKLGAPGVAEDGLAIQDLATLNVDELHPLSPEASARPPAHPAKFSWA